MSKIHQIVKDMIGQNKTEIRFPSENEDWCESCQKYVKNPNTTKNNIFTSNRANCPRCGRGL